MTKQDEIAITLIQSKGWCSTILCVECPIKKHCGKCYRGEDKVRFSFLYLIATHGESTTKELLTEAFL